MKPNYYVGRLGTSEVMANKCWHSFNECSRQSLILKGAVMSVSWLSKRSPDVAAKLVVQDVVLDAAWPKKNLK